MKIAYLITTFNDYDHLMRLINALDDNKAMFFIHVDKKSRMPENIPKKVNIMPINRIKVWWGGWSLMQAIINLMRFAAAQQDFDYYVLLSGVDYPIRPNRQLYKKLSEGGEFINIVKGFQPHKPESRVKYYYFDGFNRRNKRSIKTLFYFALEEFQRRIKIFGKRKYPFKDVYHGSTWWALSGNCVTYILNFINQRSDYVNFFKFCLIPDECFIQTIIGNSHFKEMCSNNLTYTDWSENKSGPSSITMNHIALFSKQRFFKSVYGEYEPFFARKFSNSSGELVKVIEEKLRK